ncbi:hypothetical protein IW261DRAFT_1571496 [Armillaria novae-zelandiae]|uniref:Uncharacterized protein n=1 Tax=Armillaria novae-zelandiae TaxID=153914 RepID=A0AA39NU04_9AGAR|nr:hypothetical protein IW261DRAFT_1571496 [Armillaria novae-zelandiae]
MVMGHPVTSALALTLPPPLPPLSLSPLPQPLSLPQNALTKCQCDKEGFPQLPMRLLPTPCLPLWVSGVGSLHLNPPNNTF